MAAIATIRKPGSTITEARRAANKCHLGDVFDAYHAFCAYSNVPQTWKVLAIQLAIYLDAQYFKEPDATLLLAFQSNMSFPAYLAQLGTKQLGHLASDAVEALFHAKRVLVRSDSFQRAATTFSVDVVSWNPEFSSKGQLQSLARKYYQQLTYDDNHLLLDGVKYELYRRSTAPQAYIGFDEFIESSWAPCSDSHFEILLRLNVAMSEADTTSLGVFGFYPSNSSLLGYSRKLIGFGDLSYVSTPPDRSEKSSSSHSLAFSDTSDFPETILMRVQTKYVSGFRALPTTIRRMIARNSGQGRLDLASLGSISESYGSSHTPTARQGQGYNRTEPLNEVRSKPTWSTDHSKGRLSRDSHRSSFSDYQSFVTAVTHRTDSSPRKSFGTARSGRSWFTNGTADKRSTIQTFVSLPAASTHTGEEMDPGQWSKTLTQKDIVPDPDLENWSNGRGQHPEYRSEDQDLIPLTFEHILGQTATAVVESVQCKRVRLVRKTITCSWRLKREDAIQEIKSLYRAQHSHIVRLVGTYVIDNRLAILTYPCAEWNLEQFLGTTPTAPDVDERIKALCKFFKCLAKVLDFMHSYPIKHMDIKPQNILVRDIRRSEIDDEDPFKVYITDFGSSRLYPSVEDSETDNVKSFTRAYAAQEVVLQDTSDLRADVFSMGCVYAEMLATLLDADPKTAKFASLADSPSYWDDLMHARGGADGKPRPYHLKRGEVCTWLGSLPIPIDTPELIAIRTWIPQMLAERYQKRPFARDIANDPRLAFACLSCTVRPEPEEFEAAQSLLKWPDGPL